VTDPGEFVDSALQRESSWYRAEEARIRLGKGLSFYGASVGAVRGAIRDAARRYRDLTHDDITALSSELWDVPVFERRLAAVVLLQSNVRLLKTTDLTRLEGFVRDSNLPELVDPLAIDVIGPLVAGQDVLGRVRADSVLDRWARDSDVWLRRAALLSQLRELNSSGDNWRTFIRRVNLALEHPAGTLDGSPTVREAVSRVVGEATKTHPELGSFFSASIRDL
jgi:3-methyladenine DNA glycosylase AlkD